MKIAFLIPTEGNSPSGGNKVVYEYANGLSARGHEVHVIHFAAAEPRSSYTTLRGRLRPFRYFPLVLRGQWRPDNWFKLDPSVKVELIATPWSILMPKVDAYVATWWTTAERLAGLTSLPGKRLHLIQHLETWAAPEDEVMATWKLPLEKIVIARWLEQIATDLGEPSHYIPNGFDFEKFGCDVPIAERKPTRFAMMFNERVSWKGSAFGVAALVKLKEKYPDLEAELFGVNEPPDDLPSWIVFHQKPAQDELRRIYNRASIFLAPSVSEGFGLPPCEAMMCGTAVVATDIGGHREFCIDGETAVLVPAEDSDAIAEAAARMINNAELRYRIARTGYERIQRFTWSAAVDAFERVLEAAPSIR